MERSKGLTPDPGFAQPLGNLNATHRQREDGRSSLGAWLGLQSQRLGGREGWAPEGPWCMSKSVDWDREPDSHRLTMLGSCGLSSVACRRASMGNNPHHQSDCNSGSCVPRHRKQRKQGQDHCHPHVPWQDLGKWSREQKPSAEGTSKRTELNLEYDLKKRKTHWLD